MAVGAALVPSVGGGVSLGLDVATGGGPPSHASSRTATVTDTKAIRAAQWAVLRRSWGPLPTAGIKAVVPQRRTIPFQPEING